MVKRHLLAWLILMPTWATGDDTLSVQHDPFKKPARFQVQAEPLPIAADNKIDLGLDRYKLSAILWADENSMVILEGKTLKLCDSFEGYRLVTIGERSAVFSKNRMQFILNIDKTDTASPP